MTGSKLELHFAFSDWGRITHLPSSSCPCAAGGVYCCWKQEGEMRRRLQRTVSSKEKRREIASVKPLSFGVFFDAECLDEKLIMINATFV